jgi:peptidoglycan/LPS O-acetylase OafA/YrhL
MFYSWAGASISAPQSFEHYLAADVQFPNAAPFTWFGWVGVEIFFVISGFVIANSASKSSPKEFLFGRALRLYPAVWVSSTLSFLVLLFFARDIRIRPTSRRCCSFPKDQGQWLDAVYWTLAAGDGLLWAGVLHAAHQESHAAASGGVSPSIAPRSTPSPWWCYRVR